jgi:hypothetical protein
MQKKTINQSQVWHLIIVHCSKKINDATEMHVENIGPPGQKYYLICQRKHRLQLGLHPKIYHYEN